MSTDDDQFCPMCDVSADLHDGPNSCRTAEAKARVLEMFDRVSGIR